MVLRNHRAFPTDESALKVIYLAIHNISQKWTMPIRDWKAVVNGGSSTTAPAIARGNGALSVSQPFGIAGNYEVRFNRDVASCAYSATVGRATAGSTPPGYARVAPKSTTIGSSQRNVVTVVTTDKTGNSFNSGFHLLIMCD